LIVRAPAGCAARREQAVLREPEPVFLDLVDAQGADRQHARVEAFDPALGLQVPEVELHQLVRLAEETGHLVIAQSRVFRVAPPLDVEDREEALARLPVVAEGRTVARLGCDLPLAVPVILVLDIVAGPRLGVGEDLMGFHHKPEPLGVGRLPVVGVQLLGQVPEDALHRVGVGVRAQLQKLVVIDKARIVHKKPLSGPPAPFVGRVGKRPGPPGRRAADHRRLLTGEKSSKACAKCRRLRKKYAQRLGGADSTALPDPRVFPPLRFRMRGAGNDATRSARRR